MKPLKHRSNNFQIFHVMRFLWLNHSVDLIQNRMDNYTLSAIYVFFFSGNLRAVDRGKTTLLKQSLSSLFQLYIFANCILYLRKHVNCKYGSQYNFSNVSKYTLLAVEYHIVKSKNLTCVLLISTNILSGPFNILSKFSGAI